MDNRKRFRDYENDSNDKVAETYRKMHENQNLFFVKRQKKKYASDGYKDRNTGVLRMSFAEVMTKLEHLIDESDPDAKFPQTYHFYQAGEALKSYLQSDFTQLRTDISIKDLFSEKEWENLPNQYQKKFSMNFHELYPHIKDWSWLPLIGFIHDCGKILTTQKMGNQPQWAVVGDTFPVGAPLADSVVYYDQKFFSHNKDLNMKSNPQSKKFGIYEKHCGFEKVEMSWGHDGYLPAVLNRTYHNLPAEALNIIRYHSFYPWHAHQSYSELANEDDWNFLPFLKMFQKADLYSKDETKIPDVKNLKNYYFDLIQKFIPGREDVGHDLRPAKMRW